MDPFNGRREVHTRSLEIEVRAGKGELWDTSAQLLDLRKSGFVPVAGDLQAAGLLHQMCLSARFDPGTGEIREITSSQPAVAFEPSALSEGESCRDPIENIRGLAGTHVTSGFTQRLNELIGGPRGCSHVLAEARLLGSTLAWVVFLEDDAPRTAHWRPAERIFRRCAIYDGSVNEAGNFEIAAQLTDLHFVHTAERVRPMERLASQDEVRAVATIDPIDLTILSLAVSQRRRAQGDFEADVWREVPTSTSDLAGHSAGVGWSRRVLQSLSELGAGAPLTAALLNLSPALFQFWASLADDSPAKAARDPSLLVCAAPPDSCYMWRKGGAFMRWNEREKKINASGKESGRSSG